MDFVLIGIVSLIVVVLGTLVFFFSRYKRCPSDKVLVIYGKTGSGRSRNVCTVVHLAATIQDYQWLDLTPLPIDIALQGALSNRTSG